MWLLGPRSLLGLLPFLWAPFGDDSPVAAAAEERPLPPPNVVLIVADDQGFGDFGFMGHEVVRTPRLDALAEQSLVFTRGYVTSPICRPSLGSLVTGLHPHQSGITSTSAPWPKGLDFDEDDLAEAREIAERMRAKIDRLDTLPELLATRGYASFQSGKWWEGSFARGGFTHGMTQGDPEHLHPHGDAGLRIGRSTMEPLFDFLDEVEDTPFFVWFAPLLPHIPHDPPDELLQHYSEHTSSEHVARYWAMCEVFDRACGELLDGLEARGLDGNTLVLFISDNGWVQRTDHVLAHPRSKGSADEDGVRTPVLVRWPGRIAPGRDETTLVSAVDLPRTILAAAGVEAADVQPQLEGLDLTDAAALAARKAVFGAVYSYKARDPDDPVANLDWIYMREGDWKLAVPAKSYRLWDQPALFDLGSDPGEANEIASEHPDVVRRMRAQIERWWPAGSAVSRR